MLFGCPSISDGSAKSLSQDVEGRFVVLDEESWDFDVVVFGDVWTFLDVKDFVDIFVVNCALRRYGA